MVLSAPAGKDKDCLSIVLVLQVHSLCVAAALSTNLYTRTYMLQPGRHTGGHVCVCVCVGCRLRQRRLGYPIASDNQIMCL